MAETYKALVDERGDPFQFEASGSKAGDQHRRRRLSAAQDWFKRGLIDKEALVAATRLAADYAESLLTPRYASGSMDCVDSCGEQSDRWIFRQKAATRAFLSAIEAVPVRARKPVEAILAQEMSVRESAGPGGIQGAEARTLCLVGLDALTQHYATAHSDSGR